MCSCIGDRSVRGTNPWSKIRYELRDHQERRKKSKTNLGDAEVCENETSGAGGSPDEEHLHPETGGAGFFVDQVWGSITNAEVPEPVGGDGKRHGLGSDVEGEDLASDDPRDRTPCRSEEGDVDADESN